MILHLSVDDLSICPDDAVFTISDSGIKGSAWGEGFREGDLEGAGCIFINIDISHIGSDIVDICRSIKESRRGVIFSVVSILTCKRLIFSTAIVEKHANNHISV